MSGDAPGGGELHLEQEAGVLDEGTEDEEDADDDPRLDGRETLGLRDVGRDRVEDVHQHEEDSHEQRHPPRHDVCVMNDHFHFHSHSHFNFLTSDKSKANFLDPYKC